MTKSKDTVSHILALEVSETKIDETVDDLLGQVLGGLNHARSNNLEDDRTSATDNWIQMRDLGQDIALKVGVQTVHEVREGPRKVLTMNNVSGELDLHLRRANNLFQSKVEPIMNLIS